MSMWTAITLIAIVSIIAGTIRQVSGKRSSKRHANELDDIQAQMTALKTDLEARVQTLEEIVTDRKENLRREFDYLDKAS